MSNKQTGKCDVFLKCSSFIFNHQLHYDFKIALLHLQPFHLAPLLLAQLVLQQKRVVRRLLNSIQVSKQLKLRKFFFFHCQPQIKNTSQILVSCQHKNDIAITTQIYMYPFQQLSFLDDWPQPCNQQSSFKVNSDHRGKASTNPHARFKVY